LGDFTDLADCICISSDKVESAFNFNPPPPIAIGPFSPWENSTTRYLGIRRSGLKSRKLRNLLHFNGKLLNLGSREGYEESGKSENRTEET